MKFALIEIFGFRLPEPKTNDLLLFIAILFIGVIVSVWAKYNPAFRRFILQTFTDITGRADAKLVSAFHFCGIVTFLLLRGSFFKDNWPPEAILDSLLLFIAALLGLDVANTIWAPKNKRTPPDNDATKPNDEING